MIAGGTVGVCLECGSTQVVVDYSIETSTTPAKSRCQKCGWIGVPQTYTTLRHRQGGKT